MKSHLSAPLGRSSSLKSSLRMSAIGCSIAVRPDQVRAVALLHEAHDLALGKHEDGRRDDQRVEDHEDHHADRDAGRSVVISI